QLAHLVGVLRLAAASLNFGGDSRLHLVPGGLVDVLLHHPGLIGGAVAELSQYPVAIASAQVQLELGLDVVGMGGQHPRTGPVTGGVHAGLADLPSVSLGLTDEVVQALREEFA